MTAPRDLSGWLPGLLGPLTMYVNGAPSTHPPRTTVNLIGSVSIADDPDNKRTNITISAAAGGGLGGPMVINAGTGTLNDVSSLDGSNEAASIRFSGVAPSVTSITNGSSGRRLVLHATGGPLVLVNAAPSGTVANRILTHTGSDVTVPNGASAILAYDTTSSRWRVVDVGAVPAGTSGALQTNNGSGALGGINVGSADQVIKSNGSAWVAAALSLSMVLAGVTTPEAHLAVGNGVANDTAAFTDIRDDHNGGDLSCVSTTLGARTYLATGIDQWPMGLSVFGQGPKSILKTTTNAPLFVNRDSDLADRQKAATFAHFSLLGSGKASGLGSQDLFRVGYLSGDGTSRALALDLYAKDAGGIGLFLAYTDMDGIGSVNAFCRVESCAHGLLMLEGESHGLQAWNNTLGARAGGNSVFIGGSFEDNTKAFEITAGGNDAHGMCVGTSFVHNPTAIDIAATTNGYYFTGIRIFEGDINIAAGNGLFHEFKSSHISPSDLNLNGKAFWYGITFGSAYLGTVDTTGGQNYFVECRGDNGAIPSWLGTLIHVPYTFPSDANQTLSGQQSWASIALDIQNGVATASRTITSVRPPSRGEKFYVVNRSTFPHDYKWSSGTAVTIPAGCCAYVGADGTNALLLGVCNIATAGGATVAGSDTYVQFNDGGVLGADAGLTYAKTTDVLTATGGFTTAGFLRTGATPETTQAIGLTNNSGLGWKTSGGTNRTLISFNGSDTFAVGIINHATTVSGSTLSFPFTSNATFSESGGSSKFGVGTSSCTVYTPQLNLRDSGGTNEYRILPGALAAHRNCSLPVLTSGDTFVFEAHQQTLSNKTLSGAKISDYIATAGTVAATGDIRSAGDVTWKYNVGGVDRPGLQFTSAVNILVGGFGAGECGGILMRFSSGGTFYVQGGGNSQLLVTETQIQTAVPLAGYAAASLPFRLEKADITKNDATDLTLSAAQYEAAILNISGTPGGAFNVIGPNTAKAFFVVINGTASNATIKKSGGTGVVVAANTTKVVVHNGTDYA